MTDGESAMTEATNCRTCGVSLGPGAVTGRPARYCSTPCRRAAEYALKRVNGHLSRVEWERDELRRRLAMDDLWGYGKRERERNRERLEHRLAVLDGEVAGYQATLNELLLDS